MPDSTTDAIALTEGAQPLAAATRPEPLWRRGLREPLTHFIAAGFILFLAVTLVSANANARRIVVTQAHVDQIANAYALQFGHKPDAETLQELIRRDIREEVLYREGQRLKLDVDDEIIRRRVVQKMEFLMQDLRAPAEPTETDLQAYYDKHAERYVTPSRTSFTHIFFSSDLAGDAKARERAEAVLRRLSDAATRAPERGDPFPDLYDFSAFEPQQVERLFGRTPFAGAVQTAPVGRWSGPLQSAYGWHLLRIDAREPPRRPALSEISERVRADFLQDSQSKDNGAAYADLAKTFTVDRRDRSAP